MAAIAKESNSVSSIMKVAMIIGFSKNGKIQIFYENDSVQPTEGIILIIDTSGSMDHQETLDRVNEMVACLVKEGSIDEASAKDALGSVKFEGMTPLSDTVLSTVGQPWAKVMVITDGMNNEGTDKDVKSILSSSESIADGDEKEWLIANGERANTVEWCARLILALNAQVLWILTNTTESEKAQVHEAINKSARASRRGFQFTAVPRGSRLTPQSLNEIMGGFVRGSSRSLEVVQPKTPELESLCQTEVGRPKKVYVKSSRAGPLTVDILSDALLKSGLFEDNKAKQFCRDVVEFMFDYARQQGNGHLVPSAATGRRMKYRGTPMKSLSDLKTRFNKAMSMAKGSILQNIKNAKFPTYESVNGELEYFTVANPVFTGGKRGRSGSGSSSDEGKQQKKKKKPAQVQKPAMAKPAPLITAPAPVAAPVAEPAPMAAPAPAPVAAAPVAAPEPVAEPVAAPAPVAEKKVPTSDDIGAWIRKNKLSHCTGRIKGAYFYLEEMLGGPPKPIHGGGKVDAQWTIATPNPTKGFGQGCRVYLYQIPIRVARDKKNAFSEFEWSVSGDTTHMAEIFGSDFTAE